MTQGSKKYRLPLGEEYAPPLAGLSDALVGAEYGSDREGLGFETKVRVFGKLLKRREDGGSTARGLRSGGSAALDVALVAAGSLDFVLGMVPVGPGMYVLGGVS